MFSMSRSTKNLKGEPLPKFFCRRGLQWRRLHLVIFFTEVIKFYWLMLLLYPGELYRLMGASSSLSPSSWQGNLNLLSYLFTFFLGGRDKFVPILQISPLPLPAPSFHPLSSFSHLPPPHKCCISFCLYLRFDLDLI